MKVTIFALAVIFHVALGQQTVKRIQTYNFRVLPTEQPRRSSAPACPNCSRFGTPTLAPPLPLSPAAPVAPVVSVTPPAPVAPAAPVTPRSPATPTIEPQVVFDAIKQNAPVAAGAVGNFLRENGPSILPLIQQRGPSVLRFVKENVPLDLVNDWMNLISKVAKTTPAAKADAPAAGSGPNLAQLISTVGNSQLFKTVQSSLAKTAKDTPAAEPRANPSPLISQANLAQFISQAKGANLTQVISQVAKTAPAAKDTPAPGLNLAQLISQVTKSLPKTAPAVKAAPEVTTASTTTTTTTTTPAPVAIPSANLLGALAQRGISLVSDAGEEEEFDVEETKRLLARLLAQTRGLFKSKAPEEIEALLQ